MTEQPDKKTVEIYIKTKVIGKIQATKEATNPTG